MPLYVGTAGHREGELIAALADQSRFMSACSKPAAKPALDPGNPLHRALLQLET
jgi:hypothetical protein